MGETSFPVRGLDDDRLAVHASAAAPAWLWSADGVRVLWANPAGCAVFGGEPAVLAARVFAPGEPFRAAVERLAATLPRNGPARIQRIEPIESATTWRQPPLCACSLIRLDGTDGVLLAATEAIGPALSLAERVRRLDLDGDAAVAMADGTILRTTGDATHRLAGATSIAAVGAMPLMPAALASGLAAGCTQAGAVTLRRIGSGAATLVLLRFDNAQTGAAPAAAACEAAPAESAGGTGTRVESGDAPFEPGALPARHSRRYPLRFVWQMDRSGRFTLGSDEFIEIIGARTAIALGRPWEEINAALSLDPAGGLAQAVTSRETFSHIMISWPVDDSAERLEVEVSGLPVFDRSHVFMGYRGFGVCRDVDRIDSLRAMRRLAMFAPSAAPPQPPAASAAATAGREEAANEPPARIAKNVVPFPGSSGFGEGKSDCKSLSPGEHHAFHELARQLRARLQAGEPDGTGAGKESRPLPAADNRVAGASDALTPDALAQTDFANTANRSATDRSAALATLCHDARAPLNSILGFCEMMLEERFGPIGNERYRAYLADIRKAGAQLMMLLTDALDLARIEGGTFSLLPVAVNLNEIVNECVLAMQAQANEARIIIRLSLATSVHKVLADIGAVRQIMATLLGHAIQGTRPGGQVIVSTGISAAGDAVIRLRDNGEGLSEHAIAAALEPSGPQATTPPRFKAGQSLPLTKALAEANHARLKITSKPREGSLFEVTFTARADTADSLSASR